jgi:hypothetical protein
MASLVLKKIGDPLQVAFRLKLRIEKDLDLNLNMKLVLGFTL